MAKLTSLSKEKLIDMHLDLQEEADRLHEYVTRVEIERDKLQEAVNKILPLITTILSAILNIRKIIEIIRDYKK